MRIRGGAREGAGRKPAPPLLKKTARSVKLPEWLWEWMDEQPDTNRALLIEDSLVSRHKLKPPRAHNAKVVSGMDKRARQASGAIDRGSIDEGVQTEGPEMNAGCAVGGMLGYPQEIAPFMCGYIVPGGKLCGYHGSCVHKVFFEEPQEKPKD